MSRTTTRVDELIDRIMTAYNDDTLTSIAQEVFTPDVRWYFGFGPFRDPIVGPDAVAGMLAAMRAHTADGKVQTISRLIGERYVMNITRFTSDEGSLELADAFRIEGGKVAEYWTLPEDVAEANRLAGMEL